MTKKKILIIDDDTRLRSLLGKFLAEHDFEAVLAKETNEAREILQTQKFDLLIVDVMMPNENGIDFTDDFKKSNKTPVLILTARGEPDDRIKGLEVGADDYLSKPFEPKELLLRINNILRRSQINPTPTASKTVKFGEFNFELERTILKKGEQFIHLTDGEKKILAILCQDKNKPFSREELARISGNIDERSIDVQITRLRRKIEENPKQPEFLQTVRNQGYVLRG